MEQNISKTYLVFGVSKGLGLAMAKSLPTKNDKVFGISRSVPNDLMEMGNFTWIQADLSDPINLSKVLNNSLMNEKIDAFIYNVGIWEQNAFSEEYDFFSSKSEESINIINTNVSSFIESVRSLKPNLCLSENAKVIAIGSTWGMDNHNGKEVAFSASKFALRGAIHALRENLWPLKIGVSVINLGYMATEFDITTNLDEVLNKSDFALIPMTDVIEAIKFILGTSKATCVKEVNMPAMLDQNV